ncbi:SDR family oxidoreductase [Thalassotalea psychrophila]|uniref:SDR family oxidoreductase n=1 Tax=Thalassotalea psychrophila TaxID=3065647 RepID=A0ABY9U0C9_9GAMM|nr:SDR family oxidoreductase [Colwelliaceae bacterium SQ149]
MKTVFITGAGAGIGQETARMFAKQGWFVGLYDINIDAVQALHQEIGESNSCFGHCDVTEFGSIEQAISEFSQHSNGTMHAFINNAGVLFGGEFIDVPMVQHELTIDINIKGLTYCSKAAFELLKATPNSRLINLCSVSSLHGIPSLSTYSSSKFYVKGFTEALSIEWQQHDIQVSSVMPSFVKTGMLQGVPPQLMEKLGVSQSPQNIANEIYSMTDSSMIHRVVSLKGKLIRLLVNICSDKINRTLFRYISGYNTK